MQDSKAIPQGYMTVGELAKKMGTTVRTLQYYDKEKILTPSAMSEGGRRLYTDKDMIKLHQILSLKSLGFSLEDIKMRLIALDTPADVASVLSEQAAIVKEQIESLSETLSEIVALREEVLQMQTVDFKKYADIITNLQMKNGNYWVIKYFDDRTLDHARNNFDKDSALEIIETYSRLNDEAVRLMNSGVSPDSEEGQKFAGEFWDMIVKFTGGDMSLLPSLLKASSHGAPTSNEEQESNTNDFIGPALGIYCASLEVNPFEEDI